ncbi:MAG TPA: hypothetical protein VD735_03145 [Candidatus Saccharimonadales bacterium]|nr:hypothetical protein [Candidatus Saccharimonadales bacterium]
MHTTSSLGSRGIGHIAIIVIIAVVAFVGFSGWWVVNNQKDDKSAANTALQDKLKNATCDYDDKDVCKFITSWKASDQYTATAKLASDGGTTTVTIKTTGDKSHTIMTGDTPYEAIVIDDATYIRATSGTWWKQAVDSNGDTVGPVDNFDGKLEIEEPNKDTTTYTKVGKESCDNRTCFKYQVTTDVDGGTYKQYVWFDDQDYRLRRVQTLEGDTVTHNTTISYEKVSIKAPANAKQLAPNQYLLPGHSEPTTISDEPSDVTLDEYMQALQ